MKRLLCLVALALVAGATAFAAAMSYTSFPENPYAMSREDGRVLEQLWAQYEAAHRADRPQTEAEILAQIKEQAIERHLPVDFYDAATLYVNTMARRDWRQRQPLTDALTTEVEAFNEPIVTFLWMKEWAHSSPDKQFVYVKSHADALAAGCNRALHRDLSSPLGSALEANLRDDLDYALWRIYQQRSYETPATDRVYAEMQRKMAGNYPLEGALEYNQIIKQYFSSSEDSVRREALEGIAARYEGKALALFPRAELLYMDFSDLDDTPGAGSAEYRAILERCKAFERERARFSGSEKVIADACTKAENLIETLESTWIGVSVEDGKVNVELQNLSGATLTLRKDNKKVRSWNLTNSTRSFYVHDTLTVDVPTLEDGTYSFEAVKGEDWASESYAQYTLSIVTMREAQGWRVYVTDYKTGEPLSSVKLNLVKDNGRKVASASLSLHGLTLLPKAISRHLDEDSVFSLNATSGSRHSRNVQLYEYSGYSGDYSSVNCNIYKDQGAYRPGDTMHFKAVFYNGDPMVQLNVVPSLNVTASLLDEEDNLIESREFTSNEFGSIAGEFLLPEGRRNGRWTLRIETDDAYLASESFRVDEFVLPSFSLKFNPLDSLYMSGERIPVSGTVTSYSGHSLAGARLRMQVSTYNGQVIDTPVELGADGSFASAFPAEFEGGYQVTMTVTGADGETLSFNDYVYINDNVYVSISAKNPSDARVSLPEEGEPVYRPGRYVPHSSSFVVEGNEVKLLFTASGASSGNVPMNVNYTLRGGDGRVLRGGNTPTGEVVSVDVSSLPTGIYTVVAEASATTPGGREVSESATCRFLLLSSGEETLPGGVDNLFISGPTTVGEGESIRMRMGFGDEPSWVLVTVYGAGRKLLDSRVVRVEEHSVYSLEIPWGYSWGDVVKVKLFSFKNSFRQEFERQFRHSKTRLSLPLSFERFTSSAYPGTTYTFSLQTNPSVEALAAAWDKSLDAIGSNNWPVVSMMEESIPSMSSHSVSGSVGAPTYPFYSVRAGGVMMKSAGAAPMMMEGAVMMDAAPMATNGAVMDMDDDEIFVENESYPAAAEEDVADVPLREDFATSLCFLPQLRSDASGHLSFDITTADKLTTYYVAVYAHDRNMANAFVRQEMLVSLPVQVQVNAPRFLYQGDVYELVANVSSISDESVCGTLYAMVYDNEAGEGSPVQTLREAVNVPAGQNATAQFRIQVPATLSKMALKVVFRADAFSDAVLYPVTVYPAAQTLTEAHSAVYRPGMDKEALLARLRSEFVNFPCDESSFFERTVLDMVRDAIPSHVEPACKDVLSLSEALYMRVVSARLSGAPVPDESALLEQILACRNPDGGFGWFEGMESSAIITALMLERFARLQRQGFDVPSMEETVHWLDSVEFGAEQPLWRGWVSEEQYMYVRSMYASVSFDYTPSGTTARKRLQAFQKRAKNYLTPARNADRGMQGQILSKARRLLTLRFLIEAGDDGNALARAWGLSWSNRNRMSDSMNADLASLLEYAVEHRDGGWYYPNAVLPWRGLLESEAYAHALLCDLMRDASDSRAQEIADGVRLWLMLQKETQHWDAEPAFVDAISSILDGSQAVLGTCVVGYRASGSLPFSSIRAEGNGYRISRKFFRSLDGAEVEIRPGESVNVGERIVARYTIWSGENRSFVRVVAAREAALQPVQQLSGHLGWGLLRPLRHGAVFSFTPQGYRNVKAACTEYFFDSYPEEETTLSEEFYVSRAGVFQAPVLTIESLYAPHYRANSAALSPLSVQM